MRKLFSNGLAIAAGVVSVPGIVTSVEGRLPVAPTPAYHDDPRLEMLERFFQKAEAPARVVSRVFLHEADRYDLDWRLLPSISIIESCGGKTARNNNLFGWDAGRAEFSSMSDGIRKVAYNLANSRRYKDKDLDELLVTYNPNPEYPGKVKSVMRRLARSEAVAE